MAITRADITGALKLLHANNISNRRGHLQNMLAREHSAKDVAKALADLASYPEWGARTDLDVPLTAAGAVPPVLPPKVSRPRRNE